jgi:hypothetical protein
MYGSLSNRSVGSVDRVISQPGSAPGSSVTTCERIEPDGLVRVGNATRVTSERDRDGFRRTMTVEDGSTMPEFWRLTQSVNVEERQLNDRLDDEKRIRKIWG